MSADALAEALRRLLDTAAQSEAGDEALDAARRLVEQATDALGPPREGTGPVHTAEFRRVHSIVIGTASALAPPVSLTTDADGARGTFRLGRRYEGGPGLAHGGILCLVLDHVLGEAAIAQGVGGMTVGLDVRFHAPTRLGTELTVVGKVARVDGRKVHLEGSITDGDTVTATATAVFVQLDAAQAAEIFPEFASR